MMPPEGQADWYSPSNGMDWEIKGGHESPGQSACWSSSRVYVVLDFQRGLLG